MRMAVNTDPTISFWDILRIKKAMEEITMALGKKKLPVKTYYAIVDILQKYFAK